MNRRPAPVSSALKPNKKASNASAQKKKSSVETLRIDYTQRSPSKIPSDTRSDPGKAVASLSAVGKDMPDIHKLQNQIHMLEETLKEKNELILSLRQELSQARKERESQVGELKNSVEMVIREKDSEIRRLKAIWAPAELSSTDLNPSTEELTIATHALNAPELGQTQKLQARFGISAEKHDTAKDGEGTPKSSSQVEFIRRALDTNVFLKGLGANQVHQLIDCMTTKVFEPGTNLITEGEHGSQLFVLDKGKVEVYHTKGEQHQHVIDLKAGAVFGELAILYNCKRTASVRATSLVHVWRLERKDFQAAVRRHGVMKRKEYLRLLTTVEKLKVLPEGKLLRIADCLEEATFQKGDYIIRQGDAGDIFYIIQNGKVTVTHTQFSKASNEFNEHFVCHLESGQYFGEGALLTEEKRSANIIAESSTVSVLMLDRQAFNSFVGGLGDIAVRAPSSSTPTPARSREQAHSDLLHREAAKASTDTRPSYVPDLLDKEDENFESIVKATQLNQLKTLRILGQGGFGCVKLVLVPGLSDHSFALKAIRKAMVVSNGQEEHILAEKNIMMEVKSIFIGKLYRTYRDDFFVYLLMDAYLGGEMYNMLKRKGPLKEATARFSGACILEALEYLHKKHVVYRDLKPENLMIDQTGYVKLVDFGFAKEIQPGFKTWTFCGTPEYFPPEILSNFGHDFAADFWSYGILLYELMSCSTPFVAADDMSVYENILNGIERVKFSKHFTKSAELLIRALCKSEARERLGYQKGGFSDIRKHRWFQGFDWHGLRTHRLISPFEINIESPTDTKNFSKFKEDKIDFEADKKILKKAFMDWELTF